MVDYENLPKGYLEKRKKASIRLIISIYLCELACLIARFSIIKDLELLNYLYYGSIIICGIFMFLNQTTQISYNSIPIPIYREIKIFSKKETLIYAIPMIIIVPFLGIMGIQLALIIGSVYVAVKTGIRPPDAVDYSRNNQRHYR